MEKALEFVKNNKIKLLVVFITVLIIALLIFGIYSYIENTKKEYSLTEISVYNYYKLNKDGKYGVIDTKGNIIIEAIYDNIIIPNPEKSVFICENEDKTIALNDKNEELFTQYEEVTAIQINGIVSSIPYEKTVLKYKQNGKYGIIDYEGKIITKPIYEEINGLENKESELAVKKEGKIGVINSKGAKLIKEEYDSIVADGFYSEADKYAKSGYIVSDKTSDGYRYGYISSKYEKLLSVEYNEISRIHDIEDDIYLIASKNGKYGVQKNNKVLINYSYQGIDYNKDNNFFEIQRNSKFGAYDIYGNEIIPIEYNEIEINGTYLQCKKNEEVKYFTSNGDEIEDSKYTTLIKAGDNYYITVNNEGLYGIVDREKKELIENKYSYLEYLFGDCFIATIQDGKLGIIDINDNVKVDFQYDVLQKIGDTNLVEGKILKDNLSDIYSENLEQINSSNNVAVYKENNYIIVHSQYFTKYFDLKGNAVTIKDRFKNNKLYAIEQDGKWGYEDENGELIVDYQYDKATEFNEYGFAGIKQGDKWGIINEEGTVIVEPIYYIEESNKDPEFLGKYYKVYYGYGEVYYTDRVNE